ncbi:MAG: glycosyltransferase family 87 protein [bacterium]
MPKGNFWNNVNKYFLWVLLIASLIFGYKCAKGNDFLSYYDVGLNFRALLDNIYISGKYSGMLNHYPPLFAMLMVPLTFLPPLAAGYVFFLAKLACVICVLKILPEFFEDKKIPAVAFWLAFLISFRFILDDFKLGQVNTFLTAFLIFAIYLKNKNQFWFSALFLSLAISIKIFPGLFLAYFLFKKEFKYTGICVFTLLVLNLLPALFYTSRYPSLLTHFVNESILNAAADPNSGIANQSIYGMLMRYLGVNPTDTGEIKLVNFASFSFEKIKLIYYAFSLLFISLALAPALKKNKSSDIYALGNVFLVCLILPMVVRKSNFVFVYFPALMLFAQMFKAKTQKSIKALLLWLPFVLLTFTADGVIGRKLSNLAEAFSALTIGVIFLIVANSVNLFTSKK